MHHTRHNGGVIRPRGSKWQAEINRNNRCFRKVLQTEADCRAWIYAPTFPVRREIPAMSARLSLDAADARAILPPGVTLTDAAREYVTRHKAAPMAGATMQQIYDRYVADKKSSGLRQRSIQSITTYTGRLVRSDPERPVSEITPVILADLLTAGKYQPVTRNTLRRYWLGFFDYARRLGACSENPASGIPKSRVDESTPAILTPEQAEKLLNTADARIVPALAIGLFAGLRTSELLSLRWENISDTHIRVAPEIAKKRRQRLIPMSDTLRAWITSPRAKSGQVCPIRSRRWHTVIKKVAKNIGLTVWPANGMRHSFASYHMAAGHDAARTALILGHSGNTGVFWNNYRELVTESDAVRYFAIRPGEELGRNRGNNSNKWHEQQQTKTRMSAQKRPIKTGKTNRIKGFTPVAQLDRATDS